MDNAGDKPKLSHPHVHFNWASGVLVHAVWPFLPHDFREKPYAIAAVTAWFTIGNIILHIFWRRIVVRFRGKDAKEEAAQRTGL